MLSMEQERTLKRFAAEIRLRCLDEFESIGVGHVGGSMSVCDLMACLYGGVMALRPGEPDWEDRDRFIMSKGHAGPAMYAALALRGYFPLEKLQTLNFPGTDLPSHTDRNRTAGVDMTTGSLGQGFSSGLGIALAGKLKRKSYRTYILLGDGECDEGQVWECALFAPQKGLVNLTVFVDANGRQLDGTTDEVLGLGDLGEKFRAFGWNTVDVPDGNDVRQIWSACETAKACTHRPTLVVLHTVKGKGCVFAENIPTNHNMPVTPEMAQTARARLEGVVRSLEKGDM